jgi:F-type H+-transporting ATPase subunit epsilon
MMATLTIQIVRPDKRLYEGECSSAVLVTRTGEMGIYPGHAAEICALGEGVMRYVAAGGDDDGKTLRVAVSGGYAEVANDRIVVIADHAHNTASIKVDEITQLRDEAQASLDALPEGDHRRGFPASKVRWYSLLLSEAEKSK